MDPYGKYAAVTWIIMQTLLMTHMTAVKLGDSQNTEDLDQLTTQTTANVANPELEQ